MVACLASTVMLNMEKIHDIVRCIRGMPIVLCASECYLPFFADRIALDRHALIYPVQTDRDGNEGR